MSDTKQAHGRGPSVKVEHGHFTGRDGVRLAADLLGPPDGEPVILMHGGGQTRHSWGRAARELARQGYRVINLDARGHGDSGWAPSVEHYALEHLGEDLMVVIESLAKRPALVGASLGGLTALQAIGAHGPQIAAALVLVDVVPRVDREGAARILAFMRARPGGFASVEEAAAEVAAYNPHRERPKDPSGLMKNLRRGTDGRLYWHWDPKYVTLHDRAGTQDPAIALGACRSFKNPALLVRGLRSDIVREEAVAELRAAMPHMEVVDVSEAGHMIAGDRNDVFNRALLDFLQRHHPAQR